MSVPFDFNRRITAFVDDLKRRPQDYKRHSDIMSTPRIEIKQRQDGYLYAEEVLEDGTIRQSAGLYHTDRALWKDFHTSDDFWEQPAKENVDVPAL